MSDIVAEPFWVDLILENPLDAEVFLSDLTLGVQGSSSEISVDDVEIEVVKEVILTPKQTIKVQSILRTPITQNS